MAIFDVRRIVEAHQLVDISVGKIFCRIPRQNCLAVGAVYLREGQLVGLQSPRFLCVVLRSMLVVYEAHP